MSTESSEAAIARLLGTCRPLGIKQILRLKHVESALADKTAEVERLQGANDALGGRACQEARQFGRGPCGACVYCVQDAHALLAAEQDKGRRLREWLVQAIDSTTDGASYNATCRAYRAVLDTLNNLGFAPPEGNADDNYIFPVSVNPQYSLGGHGSATVASRHELADAVCEALRASPIAEVSVRRVIPPAPPEGKDQA